MKRFCLILLVLMMVCCYLPANALIRQSAATPTPVISISPSPAPIPLNGYGRVLEENAELRMKPSKTAPVRYRLSSGEIAKLIEFVCDEEGTWWMHVDYANGMTGFILSESIQEMKPDEVKEYIDSLRATPTPSPMPTPSPTPKKTSSVKTSDNTCRLDVAWDDATKLWMLTVNDVSLEWMQPIESAIQICTQAGALVTESYPGTGVFGDQKISFLENIDVREYAGVYLDQGANAAAGKLHGIRIVVGDYDRTAYIPEIVEKTKELYEKLRKRFGEPREISIYSDKGGFTYFQDSDPQHVVEQMASIEGYDKDKWASFSFDNLKLIIRDYDGWWDIEISFTPYIL